MINLKNVTLVIPTYKRYPHLLRLLKFIFSYKTKIKILILDATPDEPINDELIKLITKSQVRWEKYDEEITYWDRVADGSNLIDTDYAVICADDDFVIPTAISQCASFLKENSKYSSANGLYFAHPNLETYSKYNFAISRLYQGKNSAEEDTALERINAYFSGQVSSPRLYSVYRLETFKLIWSETIKYVSDWGVAEIFPCALSYILGKSKSLPIFYSSRELNASAWFDDSLYKKWFSKENIEKCIVGLSGHLSRVDNFNNQESRNFLNKNFSIYLKNYENKIELLRDKSSNSLITKIRHKINFRYRKNVMFYKGCDPSIYHNHLNDFLKIKDAVKSSRLSIDELNKSREASLRLVLKKAAE